MAESGIYENYEIYQNYENPYLLLKNEFFFALICLFMLRSILKKF